MSQKLLREFDVKKIRHDYNHIPYEGILIENNNDAIFSTMKSGPRVVKSDQGFGKRGIYDLVSVNISKDEVQKRINQHYNTSVTIEEKIGTLNVFLIEPFIPHDKERYISIMTEREEDIILFSENGGIGIEDNWNSVKKISIPVGTKLVSDNIAHTFNLQDNVIIKFITSLYGFFQDYDFSYLEINPFVKDSNGSIVCLDMVSRIDGCALWKHPYIQEKASLMKLFGMPTHPMENAIETLDQETGASIKFSILNSKGRIGLILGGGGASVVTMDKLQEMGLLHDTINYGELSGNPHYRHNKEYINGLLNILCQNSNSKKTKRLCLIGGIANFTRIDILSQAFVDILSDRIDDVKKHNIHILVRRGGVNDTKGLEIIKNFCHNHDITHYVADGNMYLTDALTILKN